MNTNRMFFVAAIVSLTALCRTPDARCEMIITFDPSGWVAHNGTGIVVGGTLTSPTVSGDPTSILAPFSDSVTLANDGDYIKFKADIAMANRTGTGMNVLNTQLRFGLFNGPSGSVVGPPTPDTPNLGFVVQYSNGNGTIPNIRGYGTVTSNADPFDSSLLEPAGTAFASSTLGNVTTDAVNDSLLGTDPTASYFMMITRSNGKLDIKASIIGGVYSQSFDVAGVTTTAFPENGPFTFNRAGFFLGNNVNAQNGVSFSNVEVAIGSVPESRFGLLAVAVAMGAVLAGLKVRRARLRRNQQPA